MLFGDSFNYPTRHLSPVIHARPNTPYFTSSISRRVFLTFWIFWNHGSCYIWWRLRIDKPFYFPLKSDTKSSAFLTIDYVLKSRKCAVRTSYKSLKPSNARVIPLSIIVLVESNTIAYEVQLILKFYKLIRNLWLIILFCGKRSGVVYSKLITRAWRWQFSELYYRVVY